jgi:hypothetical protein
MKVRTLETIYDMLCESRIMYGAELWGLDEAWKEVAEYTDNSVRKY